MITVHHLGVSQSERIVWLCEELEIPYQLKRYDRDPVTTIAPPEYKALHPIGTAPIITDGDLTLPESGAIVEYINTKYGEGRLAIGPDDPAYPQFLFWYHYSNGSVMPQMMLRMFHSLTGGDPDHPVMQTINGRIDTTMMLIEKRLGEAPYFAGEKFTIADVMMFFPLTTMRSFVNLDISGMPNLIAYLQRIGARPAYLRAMAKGDPDMPLTACSIGNADAEKASSKTCSI